MANRSEQLVACSNASKDSLSEVFVSGDVKKAYIVLSLVYLLFVVVGLPWNLLVIVTIVRQRLYTQPTILLLLLNLTIPNFLYLPCIYPLFGVVPGL